MKWLESMFLNLWEGITIERVVVNGENGDRVKLIKISNEKQNTHWNWNFPETESPIVCTLDNAIDKLRPC